MTDLSKETLLFTISVRTWAARKKAAGAANKIIHDAGAVDGALRATKSLLPGAREHDAVMKSAGRLRTYVYENTLPWMDGIRILKSSGYLNFTAGLRTLKAEHERNVDDFLNAYDTLINDAQVSLSSLFVADDYPITSRLRERFAVETRFMPVPSVGDWRVELNAETISDLRRDVETQLKASQAIAMKDVFDRVFEVVQTAYERLKDPDAIFRDSLVENATKLCGILPTLNITNDHRLDQLSKQIMSTLGKHNPSTLRKDPVVRKNTAAQMKDVMQKMGALYRNQNGISHGSA